MKQQAMVEMNVPANSEALPTIREDGSCELIWRMKTGSYVRLLFENLDPIHEMVGKLGMLERSKGAPGAQPQQ